VRRRTSTWIRRSRRGKGPGRQKSPACRIDGQVEALQRPRSAEHEIARFGEDDLVDREVLVESGDAEADAAGDLVAVRDNEADVLLLPLDTVSRATAREPRSARYRYP
jgi:hypothetical protein